MESLWDFARALKSQDIYIAILVVLVAVHISLTVISVVIRTLFRRRYRFLPLLLTVTVPSSYTALNTVVFRCNATWDERTRWMSLVNIIVCIASGNNPYFRKYCSNPTNRSIHYASAFIGITFGGIHLGIHARFTFPEAIVCCHFAIFFYTC